MCFLKKKVEPPKPVSPYPTTTEEIPSPRDIIKYADMSVTRDTLVIRGLPTDTIIADIADTNSLDPLIDIGHNCILVPFQDYAPYRHADLEVGDLAVFQVGTKLTSHRIIEIREDNGRLYRFRGDNTGSADPYLLRDQHLKYLIVGIIY